MRARPIVVPAILIEDALDLSLVDRDDMIQALAAECADDSLAVPVVPGRGSSRDDRS
jgi:hypothetical protein